ncbi:DNRLRE domain-containing protein [Opitutaceae bacterium TAV4]|nr:DNRLRE domain-containing protein [Opitutaceae bacterium TAV4]RRJ99260.1 DNRLRE domain-containing protein [Opitutaceae bacterium TAV3]
MKTLSRLRSLAILPALALALIATVPAIVSTAQAATLVANQDAHIQSGTSADSNFNPATNNLQIGARGIDFNRKAYLGFNISGLIPAGQKIDAATLKLTFATFSPGTSTDSVTFNVYGIIDNNDTWDQTTLTWNNAPKNDATTAGGVLVTGTTFLGEVTFTPSATATNTIITFSSANLASYLNWAAGLSGNAYGNGVTSDTDKKVTLILTSVSASSAPAVSFYSLEGTGLAARKPQLDVTFVSQIPEPSTCALGAGLLIFTAVVIPRLHARSRQTRHC